MFISLNLILLSFFILLVSISTRSDVKVRKAMGSLLGTFGILEGGQSASQEGQSLMPSDPIRRQVHRIKTKKSTETDTLALLQQLSKSTGPETAQVVQTADNLEVEFADKALFRADGVALNPEVFTVLDRMARLLIQTGRSVEVHGFADARPSQYFPSNIELSASRAVSVARYLVEAAGMDRSRVIAEGHGVAGPGDPDRRFVKIVVPPSSLSRPLASPKEGQ